MFDIDLDFQTSFDPLLLFKNWSRASVLQGEKLTPHPCGVYPQNIARDPITHLAAIPHKEAEELGYFKIDFLHVNVYNFFESKYEIDELLKIEPQWELMKSPSVVKQLFHLGNHFDVVQATKPKSILDVADCLALIRPGKRWLLDKYLEDKTYARKLLYKKNENDTYFFKKSHAIAYAHVIVLQLHLIANGIDF